MSEDSKYAVRAIMDEALNLFELKNADYGDAWKEQGWRGNLAKILNKAARLNKIWRGGTFVVEENLRETAIDMINTLAFLVVNHDVGREWGHEQAPPVITMTDEQARQFVDQRTYEHWQNTGMPQTILPMVSTGFYDKGGVENGGVAEGGQEDTAFVKLNAQQTREAINPPATVPTKKARVRKGAGAEPEDTREQFGDTDASVGS